MAPGLVYLSEILLGLRDRASGTEAVRERGPLLNLPHICRSVLFFRHIASHDSALLPPCLSRLWVSEQEGGR